ncbi:GSCOCG00004047001-RA-CDS [Cotesia congregata]|uniref:Similar to Nup50: Nuclear pore complex protein Nup50 (Drosophila melanogaster) n=1 Tax=Cotesia congregata TaxID=51543 RepID=A0A8J2H7H4_COTCN|nr:GSCOCG00004047001-RA-CDS [Cotesia congregata]CAG5082119.1 Similar to Nup50: Nuclear pore complex protein Nup50 (Drosophila melanogaster) [Cotesia congregata]
MYRLGLTCINNFSVTKYFIVMAGKRNATSELNHDNWNNEEEPEDAGTFTAASPEELQKRVVKTAKRRIVPGSEAPPTKNAFSSFSGFKVSSAAPTSAFSFLSKSSTTTASLPTSTATKTTSIFSKITPTTNGTKATDNGLSSPSSTKLNDSSKPTTTTTTATPSSIITKSTNKIEEAANKNKEIFAMSSEYYTKLKDLNQSVSQWIKTHVDSNAFCILSPIFRDYENHLKIIQTQYGKSCEKEKSSQEEEKKKSPSGIFTSGQSTASTSASVSSSASTSVELPPSDKPPASIFGSTQSKSIFSGISSATSSAKEPSSNKEADSDKDKNKNSSSIEKKSLTFPQTTSLFSFGSTNSGSQASFTFGSGKSHGFNIGKRVPEENRDEDKDDEDEPPKVEIKPITEEGAIYEKRCKVYLKNKETGAFSDRGIGVLFLKPTPNEKTQLIVRAETSLGNLLLNTLLTKAVPTKKINKNTVMLMCLPLADSKPPPVPVYLRVKTSEDADALLEALESNKK